MKNTAYDKYDKLTRDFLSILFFWIMVNNGGTVKLVKDERASIKRETSLPINGLLVEHLCFFKENLIKKLAAWLSSHVLTSSFIWISSQCWINLLHRLQQCLGKQLGTYLLLNKYLNQVIQILKLLLRIETGTSHLEDKRNNYLRRT